ncbi:MAG: type VI secretion system lipoprotein TssJ [Desulfotalea sp.]
MTTRELSRLGAIGIAVMLVVTGCGGSKPPPNPATVTTPASSPAEMHWTYQIGAISLTLEADKKLNEYNNSPHTLLLCVYQLSDVSKFTEMTTSKSGLTSLYDCKAFDASVKKVSREFVQPDSKKTLVLDRAEGAIHLAVAAAYYDLQGDGTTRTWQVPMDISETGSLWWSDKLYAPGKLEAILLLGSNEIQKVGE